MVDMLTAVLSGANWGPFVPPFALFEETPSRSVGKGIGHFFGAMEIEGFSDVTLFKKRVDDWIEVFRETKPASGSTVFRLSNRWSTTFVRSPLKQVFISR
jgi:LDH2 family malate/lactate/ureidoglycolate dehydrogenase